ncbi:MAG: 30S ribosomal protein S12 methylthiotransferase RimO [Thermodesulfovibrionales bacterium]
MRKIAFITLGCPKNQSDTEGLVERLRHRGFLPVDSMEGADACVVNTCCFIDDAKRESIEAILTCAAVMKGRGQLIVWGCMGERYAEQLHKEIPEIASVFGVNDLDRMISYMEADSASHHPAYCRDESGTRSDRVQVGVGAVGAAPCARSETPYAYVKIADGCDRGCSFCVIPGIRGPFRSIGVDAILQRVRSHLKSGVREIVLVAQDITSYGKDLGGAFTLSGLVGEIVSLEGDFWVRLLYLHPLGIDAELIETVAREEKVCKYIDIPVQHSVNGILRAMRRGHTQDFLVRKVEAIREGIPSVALRTTVMVGYPGETPDDFEKLLEFVECMQFDRLGAFRYSPQEGTGAWRQGPRVSEREKRERFDRLMTVQSAISLRKNVSEVGRRRRVLVDEVEGGVAVGRLGSQAPEIDGTVVIRGCSEEWRGRFADVEITEAYDYDLAGRMVSATASNRNSEAMNIGVSDNRRKEERKV